MNSLLVADALAVECAETWAWADDVVRDRDDETYRADRAEAKLQVLTNACKKIASGMTTDLLGTCSLGREDMQDIAKAALEAAGKEE